MYVNQKLIAERAGVSCATVSRAFTKNARVRPATLAKIHAAMNEMGFEEPTANLFPDAAQTKQVLVIVNDISDEYYATTIKGISDHLHSLHMVTTICNSNLDFEIEKRYLEFAEQNHFAGVIMLSVLASSALVKLLESYTLPVILVNRFLRALDMDVVTVDNYRGGYMAARHLIENGHRRIAFLSGSRHSTAPQDRLHGFTDAMADCGIDFGEEHVFWGDNTRSSGRDFVNSFFERPNDYTAIFASNNPMAMGALTRLLEMGYRVPEDISIICFDDTQIANDGIVKLTTVSYDPYLMGHAAVDSLMKRIENPLSEKNKIAYSPSITVRDSVKKLV